MRVRHSWRCLSTPDTGVTIISAILAVRLALTERRDHRAGAAGHAIPFPRLEVAGEVRDVIDHTGVNRGRYDREQQRHRAHPQRTHGDMQDERGRIEGRQNRNELVLPPLVCPDEINDEADAIVLNETRIAQ